MLGSSRHVGEREGGRMDARVNAKIYSCFIRKSRPARYSTPDTIRGRFMKIQRHAETLLLR